MHARAQQQRVGAQNVSTSIHSDVNAISIKHDLVVPVRSGRSVLLKKKKGPNTCSSFSQKTVFLGLHGICSMSATNQYQLIWQEIFHSVRSSALWREVKTRPDSCSYDFAETNDFLGHKKSADNSSTKGNRTALVTVTAHDTQNCIRFRILYKYQTLDNSYFNRLLCLQLILETVY